MKIRWGDRDYPGVVGGYNEESRFHTINYDDGDVKASNLYAKIWTVVSPP